MKNITKLLIGIGILLLLITGVSAALNTGLKAPDEFEKSTYWEKNDKSDIYSLKNDNNTLLYIDKYSDDLYDTLFKDDPELDYHVNKLNDTIMMGKDNGVHDGYVMEIIEYNGEKYIVNICISDNPDNAKIKDSANYLDEFNKLNNIQPIKV